MNIRLEGEITWGGCKAYRLVADTVAPNEQVGVILKAEGDAMMAELAALRAVAKAAQALRDDVVKGQRPSHEWPLPELEAALIAWKRTSSGQVGEK